MINKYGLKNPIQGVSLITSCGCNLQCEYCKIAQAVNSNAGKLQAGTIQGLQDGSFLENCQKVFNKLEQSPAQVTSMDFWGQEPTLTLHLIAEHIKDWFEVFPNWIYCSFSTNTVAHMDRLITFFKACDEAATHEFHINVQLSYDGDYSTNNLRGASSSVIHDNLVYLYNELNKITFNNITIRFNNHGVLSFDLLKKLQTVEDIFNYTLHLYQWGDEFVNLNRNSKVEVTPGVDISLEAPAMASTEDGLRLANFFTLSERINPQDYLKYFPKWRMENIPYPPHISLCLSYGAPLDGIEATLHREFNIMSLSDAIERMACDHRLKTDIMSKFNRIMYCGNGVHELKIMYDGTLINCQNHIFDTQTEFLKDNGDLESSVKKALAEHKYFINPLTDDDDTIRRYFHLFDMCKNGCLEFMIKSTATLMRYCVETRQIDGMYLNKELLIKTALLVSVFNCCSYNNQMTTGSIFLRHTGFIRAMCNGFLPRVIDIFNSRMGREVF